MIVLWCVYVTCFEVTTSLKQQHSCEGAKNTEFVKLLLRLSLLQKDCCRLYDVTLSMMQAFAKFNIGNWSLFNFTDV